MTSIQCIQMVSKVFANGIQSVCKSRAVFAFVVELHLRSYQERKCESLQSNFKLKQSCQIQIKCKETVTNHGRRVAMLLQKMGNVELSLRRASRGQSPRLIGFFKLSSIGCSPPTQHYCNTNYFGPIHYFPTTAIIVCSIIVSILRTFARNFLRKCWFLEEKKQIGKKYSLKYRV